MLDFLGLDTLVAEMTLGIGLALLAGNGYALWRHRRGMGPPKAGPLRIGRVWFLMGVGAVMSVAGLGSLVA